jgi:hypothetical protein
MKHVNRSLTSTTSAPNFSNSPKRRLALRVSTISMVQFMVLCGLFDGADTSGIGDAKANLVEAAYFGIWQTDAYRDDVIEEEFEGGTAENLKASLAELDEERREFVELAAVIDELDHDAAAVIFKGVAQVYAGGHFRDKHAFYERCVRVYLIMQGIA